MKKNILLASLFFSAMTVLNFSTDFADAADHSKIGVVQLDKLYTESKIGQAAFERFNLLQNKAVSNFESLQKELEKAKTDKNQKEEERLQKKVQEAAYFLQNVLKADQENVARIIDDSLKKAYDQYISFHTDTTGIVRSDMMAAFNPSSDITNDVKEILDKLPIDFGAMPSLEIPKLPEPKNATGPSKKEEKASVTNTQPPQKK